MRAFNAGTLLLVSTLLVRPALSAAQQARLDSVGGRLFIVYTDLDGISRRAEVPLSNRIDPQLTFSVGHADHTFEYRYAVENRAGPVATTAVLSLDIPCAERDATPTPPAGWTAEMWPRTSTTYCYYSSGTDALPPGETRVFLVRSSAFPGIDTARFFGAADFIFWPSEEGTVPKAAHALADSLQGFETGGVNLPLVAPIRTPDAMDAPGKVIAALRGDLNRACELNWITNSGICKSLRVKLDHTAASLEQGHSAAARGQLGSVLSELDAQHGPQPGKHVNDAAYWLLKTNAEHLLELI
jgi:hypothetical protein